MNKKAQQMNQLPIWMGAIAGIIILLLVLLVFFSNIRAVFPQQDNTVLNELGFINSSGYQLQGEEGKTLGMEDFVITSIINSSGFVIHPNNATISSSGLVTNSTAQTWPNTAFNYTYNYDDADRAATDSTRDSLINLVPLILLIPLVVVLATILAIVISSFWFGGRGRA